MGLRLQDKPVAPRWAWALEDALEACRRCALVEDPCWQGRELWEAVTRAHGTRSDEKEINRASLRLRRSKSPTSPLR